MTTPQLKIIYDFDNTLSPTHWAYNKSTFDCGRILSEALGDLAPYYNEIMSRRTAIDNELIKTWGFDVRRFPTSWVMLYRELCADVGVESKLKIERRLFREAAKFAKRKVRPFNGVPNLLCSQRVQGHQLYLVTAGPADFQNWKIDVSGLRLLFDSEAIFTPPKEKFDVLRQIVGADARQSVIIGDSPRSEIADGRKLGTWTILKLGSTWSYGNDAQVESDFTVKSMADVPRCINSILEKLQ